MFPKGIIYLVTLNALLFAALAATPRDLRAQKVGCSCCKMDTEGRGFCCLSCCVCCPTCPDQCGGNADCNP